MPSIVVACGTEKDPADAVGTSDGVRTAAAFAKQTILTNSEYLDESPYAGANLELGQRLAIQCRACHTLEAGGATLLGPNLSGVFGRPAASRENFEYSRALSEARFVWTPDALDAWLAEPARFLPGNRMAFAGIREAADRQALIAFLLHATDADPKELAGNERR
jgi:cytochrome c